MHLCTPQICAVGLQTCTSGLLHEYCHIFPPSLKHTHYRCAILRSFWSHCNLISHFSAVLRVCVGCVSHLTLTVVMGETRMRQSELSQRVPVVFYPLTNDLRADSQAHSSAWSLLPALLENVLTWLCADIKLHLHADGQKS